MKRVSEIKNFKHMKLNIVSIPKTKTEPMARIYSNGHLSLNRALVDALGLTPGKDYHVALALDDIHKPEEKMYLVFEESAGRSTRKVLITNRNCTVNFSRAFDELGLDYLKKKFYYDLEKEDTWEGRRVVVLDRRK